MNDSVRGTDGKGRDGAGARVGGYARGQQARRTRIGRLLLAVLGNPAPETASQPGTAGDEHAAHRLNALLHGRGVVLVHHRRMPGSQACIDHVAIGPGGVTVIDTQRIRGKVRVRRETGRAADAGERLMVDGHDQTELVAGVSRQVTTVRELLGGTVAVIGAMCFVESGGLPLFSTPKLEGVRIAGLRGVARLARRDGPHTPGEVREIAERLTAALPEA